ncbi:MAG TPA: flagellar hook-associated protein FlgL, partial [Thermoguttaceae bacterium]|nr:flagellar hook-associated protein FlgL [Thermoguttaceae bacterium]
MGTIIGIPTTRVSDQFVRQRLANQVQSDQLDLFQIQMQMSTGRRFLVPSEDSTAAARVISLQRLLERKDQVQSNVLTNQSYLMATDTALSSISNNMAEVRSVALGVIGTLATDTQRGAAAQQVRQSIQQLTDIGNQKFRGRYLFAGTQTSVQPFGETGNGMIRYSGNEGELSSYSDIDLLFETNLNGNDAFGAISNPVRGSEDLNPVVTFNTRLADLNGGKGVTSGSISISSSSATSIIDISSAETIGDVASLIRNNPPTGTALNVEITPTGLNFEFDPILT